MDQNSPESEETSSTSGPREIPLKDSPGGKIIGNAIPLENIGHFEIRITDDEAWQKLFVNPGILDLDKKYEHLPNISIPLPGFTKNDPPVYDRRSRLAFKIDEILESISDRLLEWSYSFSKWGVDHYQRNKEKK